MADNQINNRESIDELYAAVNRGEMVLQTVHPPYDEYEAMLIDQIKAIERAAYEQAEPYRNKLVQSRINKVPKYVFMPKVNPNE